MSFLRIKILAILMASLCIVQFTIHTSFRLLYSLNSNSNHLFEPKNQDRESSRAYGVKTKLSAMPEWEIFRIKGLSYKSTEQIIQNRSLIISEIQNGKNGIKVLTSFKGIGESTAQKVLEQVSME